MIPWIHIGECPVCVNGLCRIRYCEDEQGRAHLYAMCDECEAIWLEPVTDSPRLFPDAENPVCPTCCRPLYGEQAHWARSDEIVDAQWSAAAIFEVPSVMGVDNEDSVEGTSIGDDGFITAEDIANDLDAPPQNATDSTMPLESRITVDEPKTREADIAYGQDEPKPGC